MNKRLLLLWISALFLLAGTALAACGDDDDDDGGGGGSSTSAAEVKTIKPGTLVVGVDVPYPPFEQGRPPDYEGFEIDLMNEIASRLDLETEYKDTPFDTIFRDLAQGKFDAAIAGSTILPEREKVVDFGDPWFLTEQSLLVQKGSDIKTLDDLDGKTVGVQKGTTGEDYVQDHANAGDLRSYPEIDDAFNALVAGQVDAVVFDLSGTEEAAKKLDGLEVVGSYNTGEYLAPAYAEDNDALREAANKVFKEMKDDGTLAQAYQEWFKLDEPPKAVLEKTNTPK
jgi:polar amino acid transport system substrate-binding protein